MNIYRLCGDLSHFLAIIILLLKIWKSRSCAGISVKSQILLALVYTTRYLDLATTFISAYNSIMKILFLTVSYGTIILMYKSKTTCDHSHDTFRIGFLIVPAAILSLLINHTTPLMYDAFQNMYYNHTFDFLEIMWTFSVYLESVALVPQLYLMSKTGKAENVIIYYLFALGFYRAMYIVNWKYRYDMEQHYDIIAIVAGIVQIVINWIGCVQIFSLKSEIPDEELSETGDKITDVKSTAEKNSMAEPITEKGVEVVKSAMKTVSSWLQSGNNKAAQEEKSPLPA